MLLGVIASGDVVVIAPRRLYVRGNFCLQNSISNLRKVRIQFDSFVDSDYYPVHPHLSYLQDCRSVRVTVSMQLISRRSVSPQQVLSFQYKQDNVKLSLSIVIRPAHPIDLSHFPVPCHRRTADLFPALERGGRTHSRCLFCLIQTRLDYIGLTRLFIRLHKNRDCH